jgi:hypothetical protein
VKRRIAALPEFNQPLLINILGHAGGALIFAIFLCLLYSGRGWSGVNALLDELTREPDFVGGTRPS